MCLLLVSPSRALPRRVLPSVSGMSGDWAGVNEDDEPPARRPDPEVGCFWLGVAVLLVLIVTAVVIYKEIS